MDNRDKSKDDPPEELIEPGQDISEKNSAEPCSYHGAAGGQENLEFYKNIIAAVREPILILNSDLNCVFANRSFVQVFNIDTSAIYDQSIFSIGNRFLNVPELKELLNELLSIHQDFNEYEVNLDLIHIGNRAMSLNATDTAQQPGEERLILLSFEDITIRHEAEKQLLESERKYRTLFDSSRDAIMMLAPPDWSFTAGNPATIELFRCNSESDFTSCRPWELSPEYQPDGQISSIKAKMMIESAVKTGSNLFEWTHSKTDGEIFQASVLLSRIELQGHTMLQATVRDITGRKEVEEELRNHRFHLEELVRNRTAELSESEEKYRTLVEHSHDGIYIYAGGGFLFVNNRMCDMTGYTKVELAGMKFWELAHPEDLERIREYELLRESGADVPSVFQVRVVKKDGIERYIEFSAKSITYHGEYAVLGVGRDITALKLFDEEQSKMDKLESLGILAGGIAHDFNNFLAVIIGNISLARLMVEPGSNIYEILTSSEHAASQASALTRQLLTFSKGGEPVKDLLSITTLLQESCNFILSGSNVIAEFNFSEDLRLISADPGQITQVINNIILNANQAMPEGGRIFISAENTDISDNSIIPLQKDSYIKIQIEDEGIGIPEEQLTIIFDPFFSTKQLGTGLGLSTAYSIIHKHHGHILVESGINSGSKFIIYLPSVSDIMEEKQMEIDFLTVAEGKILIMDDKEIIRDTVKAILNRLGYEVECAVNGREAIEKYSDSMKNGNSFDAVILDLTIPNGMGGTDTIKELLSIDPDVRAIVSSGYSTDPVMSNYETYGFSGVMLKPYSISQIAYVLQEVIDS
ncbi:MAG: PAS domain S-box protein [Candidatus Aegiribacteria sp.]|nr:PAS domain S-box protein [Candidatus Aegiribacteria sp.]